MLPTWWLLSTELEEGKCAPKDISTFFPRDLAVLNVAWGESSEGINDTHRTYTLVKIDNKVMADTRKEGRE